ncbi:uncharacterized protein LOC125213930 [Salvia hispanica]|uniref:uncharacterized protein LOC125213930 n=1 Tax=Salvia hispanica TaxID=49212 RepID=UPI0020092624|nr:uncharacterized protein LOC125213930 [Salvia hispanica]
MAKKRKSEASRLDEVDRGMYTTFCSAANSLSQLYTHAMHQQRLSFQAGERHSLEKLYNWISRQQEQGVRVMGGDILAYLQNELDYGTEEPPLSHRQQQAQPQPHPQQQPNNLMQLPQTGVPLSSNAFGPATTGQGLRAGNLDQSKNYVFSNALSSPVRRTLQHYHLSQGGFSSNNATRSNENSNSQNRDANPLSSNDTLMDMHSDSPGHDSPY